jgi:Ca2+-binding EF-hand superfamily protein
MSIKTRWQFGALAMLMALAMSAGADDKSDYNRRAAASDLELFQSLDRDTDGVVTRMEARSDINFLPRFDDMEADMDGAITRAELHRYIDQQYGVSPSESAGSR